MIKDVKRNSKGSAMDTLESNEESSVNSGASQRSKQLGYFFEKIYWISKLISNNNNFIDLSSF